jgi:hypothetical protein
MLATAGRDMYTAADDAGLCKLDGSADALSAESELFDCAARTGNAVHTVAGGCRGVHHGICRIEGGESEWAALTVGAVDHHKVGCYVYE